MKITYLYEKGNRGLGDIFEAPGQLQQMALHYLRGARNNVQNFINWLRQLNVEAGWTKINGSLVGYVLLNRDEDNWQMISDMSVRMEVSIIPIWGGI